MQFLRDTRNLARRRIAIRRVNATNPGMIVIDCDRPAGRPERVGLITSCRLRTPLMKIKEQGGFQFRLSKPPLTHSFAESRQIWRHATGQAPVPPELVPYIFGQPTAPAVSEYPPDLLDGIDTFIVEMCDIKQIHFDEWVFQSNYFSRGFVQRHAMQLLAWYRQFGKLRPVDPALTQAAIRALAEAGVDEDEIDEIEPILRRAEMRKMTRQSVVDSARELVFDPSKRWIFVSHFTIPGDDRLIMHDRRELAASIKVAAETLGAEFFDPTRLVAHYGHETVLRGGGADIYEYGWDFVPVVGRTILNMLRDGAENVELPPLVAPSSVPRSVAPPVVVDSTMERDAARANQLLLEVGRTRLAAHGVQGSGLYDHYLRLLESGEIVRSRDTRLAAAVRDSFADFDHYYVLKAGMGAVPIMLALGGLRVDAAEGNPNRAAALRDALVALAAAEPEKASLMTVHGGRIPPPRDGERSLVIAVGISPGSEADRLREQIEGHDAVLFERNSLIDRDDGAGSVLARLGLSKILHVGTNLAVATAPEMAVEG